MSIYNFKTAYFIEATDGTLVSFNSRLEVKWQDVADAVAEFIAHATFDAPYNGAVTDRTVGLKFIHRFDPVSAKQTSGNRY